MIRAAFQQENGLSDTYAILNIGWSSLALALSCGGGGLESTSTIVSGRVEKDLNVRSSTGGNTGRYRDRGGHTSL